jgi:hypothetical protein
MRGRGEGEHLNGNHVVHKVKNEVPILKRRGVIFVLKKKYFIGFVKFSRQ